MYRALPCSVANRFKTWTVCCRLCKKVRETVPEKDIWAYSGYTWDELIACPAKRQLLEQCDILVDGKFVDALRDPSLQFRGSKNQRIIDVKKSLAQGEVVIAMD